MTASCGRPSAATIRRRSNSRRKEAITTTERSISSSPSPEQVELEAPDATLDSLQLFFNEARRHPLLTAREEVDLAQRIERGDMEAKDRLINSNLRLVISVARKYQGQGLPLGDLVQEGMLGLIRAAEKFDWRKGFKFSTYGTLWIRQAIQRGLENSGRTIRLPVHVGQRARKIARTERSLTVRLGREPTEEEIAAAVELPIEEVSELRATDRPLASLDQPVGDDGESALGDLMADERPEPADEVVGDASARVVREAIERLPEQQREVVRLRFGVGGEEPVPLRETGRRLGLSAERVRQLEDEALEDLAANDELAALQAA